jgi:FG-GAP repeat
MKFAFFKIIFLFAYEICLGAPGTVLSAVHVLYMHRNMTVKSSVVIRGDYIGDLVGFNGSKFNNGPPIHYMSKFGIAVANVGDIDNDGIDDIAVGQNSESAGEDFVHILFMLRNGTVRSYSTIGSNIGGGPDLKQDFSKFGSSIVGLGDFDQDSINDIVIGAKFYDDMIDSNTRSGEVSVPHNFNANLHPEPVTTSTLTCTPNLSQLQR